MSDQHNHVDSEWERGWTAAVQLFAHLSRGGAPQPITTSLRLLPHEQAYADLPLSYSRYYGTGVHYTHTHGLFLGRPLFMAVGYAATAISNVWERSRAEREASPQWRDHTLARTVLTNQRVMCLVHGQWLLFDHDAVVEFTADPPRFACYLTFTAVEPLCLTGYAAPFCSVLFSYFLYGSALVKVPYLAPLAQITSQPASRQSLKDDL